MGLRRENLTSVYEFMEANHRRPESALSSINVDLELLNNKITQSLLDLGLTDDEAKVLLFMNKKGERKASEIAKDVGIPRTRLYYVLESLQSKGVVFSTVERPARYRALPLEKAIDFLIDSCRHKLHSLEKAKQVIFHDWSLLQEYEVVKNPEPELAEENIQIISGEHQIYGKAANLIMQAEKEVNVFVNARNLAKISYADITDKLQLLASNGIDVKVLTNLTPHQTSLLEEIHGCEIREIPSDFNDKALFIIIDRKELFLVNLDKAKKASGIWTNSRFFIDAMSLLFTAAWRSSSA